VNGRLVQIGRTLHSKLKDFFDSPLDAGAMPLEIVQAVLDALERKVEPVGRGQRLFPYNRVLVRLGPTQADRVALQAAFDRLEARFRERLSEVQCTPPDDLQVRVVYLKRAPAEWPAGQFFSVECASEAAAPAATATAARQHKLRMTIVKGAAAQPAYEFDQPVVSIGRTAEPVDERGRVRRNDVVFADTLDGITETVGRAHARLELDGATAAYRAFNDGSSNPTFIVRAGTTIQIPPRDPRGVRVRSGDELHLGRAIVRLSLEE
jgi:pSer/pThr/pTyr-binding forkhead associated (FHA) protein